jgi:hypothetical protein
MSEHVSRDRKRKQMRTIAIVCRRVLPLGALLLLGFHLSVGTADAQVVDVRQACTPDAMRLCNEFIPDEGRVKACMMAKRRQLSIECRTAIAAMHQGGRVVRVRHVSHHHRHHR